MCNSCRLCSGFSVSAAGLIPKSHIKMLIHPLATSSATFPVGYKSSKDATRYHCGTCGARVLYENASRPSVCNVPLGLVVLPEGKGLLGTLEDWFAFLKAPYMSEDAVDSWMCEKLSKGLETR